MTNTARIQGVFTPHMVPLDSQGRINEDELRRYNPGGGFEPYAKSTYEKYSPGYDRVLAAHSIYFQVLGEHGFIALGLFLLFWALVWRMCSQVAALARDRPDTGWAYWLAQMIKVSMVAYLVGGAFLNLAYWDAPYYLFVAVAVGLSGAVVEVGA